MTEDLEIWFRDPVDCVKELMGNPMFRDAMTYKPTCVWLDEAGTQEVIGEMASRTWSLGIFQNFIAHKIVTKLFTNV